MPDPEVGTEINTDYKPRVKRVQRQILLDVDVWRRIEDALAGSDSAAAWCFALATVCAALTYPVWELTVIAFAFGITLAFLTQFFWRRGKVLAGFYWIPYFALIFVSDFYRSDAGYWQSKFQFIYAVLVAWGVDSLIHTTMRPVLVPLFVLRDRRCMRCRFED
jgi:hypothetical protein